MRLRSFAVLAGTAVALQPLPPVQWTNTNALSNGFDGLTTKNSSKTIYIENAFADVADTEGLTLIPPTAFQFAQTFRQDLANWTNANWTLQRVDSFPENAAGIFLGPFRGSSDELKYENGDATEEGYEIEITNRTVYIGGTGARGMFWGSRTLLQQALIAVREQARRTLCDMRKAEAFQRGIAHALRMREYHAATIGLPATRMTRLRR